MNEKHEGIAEQINKHLNVNIFDNVRTTQNVDARALYCFILRNDLKYTLYTIRDIFNANGKKYDHSTVHYNVKLFEEVRHRRKDLEDFRDCILQGVSPKYLLIKLVETIDTEDKAEEVLNCITLSLKNLIAV
jgi:hypothetical protein